MGYKQKRKIVRLGATSKAMVLPKGWLDFYDLKEGDGVTVLGDSILVVCHPRDERKARRILGLVEGKGMAGSTSPIADPTLNGTVKKEVLMNRREFYEVVTEQAANEISTGAVGDPDRKATINIAVVGHILRVALERMKQMTLDEIASLIQGD